jgi:hypothetical protein
MMKGRRGGTHCVRAAGERERERRQRVSREGKARMECLGGGRRAATDEEKDRRGASDQCTAIA